MRVLIGCEFSGVVRRAFRARGHVAYSCDTKAAWDDGEHIVCDVLKILEDGWDLAIFHPPCKYLANCTAKHLYIGKKKGGGRDQERWENMRKGAEFFARLLNAPIPRVCVENPVMLGYAKEIVGANFSQSVQPWQFGHGETKRTCFWLRNLPNLKPTKIVSGREQRIHRMSPSEDRSDLRSITYQGIAEAMADQWGDLPVLDDRKSRDPGW